VTATTAAGLLPAAILGTVHAVGLAARRPLTDRDLVLLTDLTGALVIALASLVAGLGMASRSQMRLLAPVVAVVFGALSIVEPENALILLVALLAVGVAAAMLVRGALAGRRVVAYVGTTVEAERLRLRHGRSHISCFAGEARNGRLVVEDGMIGYEVRAGAAVAVGDPLTAPERRPEAVAAFVKICAARGWAPCFYQTDAALRPMYRAAGFHLFKLGEEALIDLSAFRLETPAAASARHEIARARRHGLEPVMLSRLGPWDPTWDQMAQLSARWIEDHGGRELGFSLGRFGEVVDRDTWYTLARDQDGHLHAFCSWLRLGDDGVALDLVRRRPDASPGAVDLCVVAAINRAQNLGLGRVSLGLVPLRDSLGDASDGRLGHWIRGRLYRKGLNGYRYRSLAHFKGRFATHWESRDVAMPRGPGLPFAVTALIQLHLGGASVIGTAPPAVTLVSPA
jgi:lysylphosphatidylglycerol synthetase-like protein (DUF2156 family)